MKVNTEMAPTWEPLEPLLWSHSEWGNICGNTEREAKGVTPEPRFLQGARHRDLHTQPTRKRNKTHHKPPSSSLTGPLSESQELSLPRCDGDAPDATSQRRQTAHGVGTMLSSGLEEQGRGRVQSWDHSGGVCRRMNTAHSEPSKSKSAKKPPGRSESAHLAGDRRGVLLIIVYNVIGRGGSPETSTIPAHVALSWN
ncbi:unnamed protein product [Arctogadus glacialis]